jgi:hypothetical protein
VTQGVDPEFKPQYLKKRKKKDRTKEIEGSHPKYNLGNFPQNGGISF